MFKKTTLKSPFREAFAVPPRKNLHLQIVNTLYIYFTCLVDYEKLKELSDQFLADWFDTDKYPATELTYRQKEYMGLGLGAYNLKTIDDDTDDENQKEGCTYVDTPAWQRMEWRRISADTRASFIDALKKLAVFYPDSKATESGLDIFVKMHRFLNMPGGIRGASLLPLNREYLFR